MDSFVKLITVFNIKIINRSNRNYQCKTKGLLDLSMSGSGRLAKANPGRHVETLRKGAFPAWPRRTEDVFDH
jgi:hypothetical protein